MKATIQSLDGKLLVYINGLGHRFPQGLSGLLLASMMDFS